MILNALTFGPLSHWAEDFLLRHSRQREELGYGFTGPLQRPGESSLKTGAGLKPKCGTGFRRITA